MHKKILSIIVISMLLVGCKHGEKSVKTVKNDDKNPSNEHVIDKGEIDTVYAPLSGLPISQASEQRPVAVMVNNYYLARPQSGLSNADVVYEILAEGDITRFLAIFQSNIPEKIGPVRSARDYYINLANGYHALFICHGNSPKAKQMMDSGMIDALNGLIYDGTLFKRDKTRKAPHNSYILKEGIEKGVVQRHYSYSEKVTPLDFTQKDLVFDNSWKNAGEVFIKYSHDARNNVTYKYSNSTKQFQRVQNGIVAKDALNGKELQIKNILVVEATHKIIDSYGRRSIDIEHGGKGYYIVDGKYMNIQWRNVDGRIIPFTLDGTEIKLSPGQTWINFVPFLKDVTIK
ncbi:lipoprotein YerB [Bacillus sp. AFS001701]|uniref:DUF3048 domain-containing protein n=1 Tax=Bacillaceae TaxID=186817 RepID=UPI000BF37101|nr:DUF3048 domain-containing protein [Bacillus sp. AFS001701]PET57626.1 lipoprotein YerB [Bacillus sp. AFS001701]